MRGPLNCTLSRGLGGTKIFEATHGDVVVSIRGERYFTQPWGLAGGQPAASAQAWIERADGSIEEIPSKRVFTLRGVTVLMAREQYGVVLQEPELSVDQEATQRLRTALQAQRVGA